MRKALLIAGLVAAASTAPLRASAAEAAQELSLVALLADPQRYDGQIVRVEGYFDGSHHEDCRLFLSKADFDYYLARNSIYVEWPGCLNRRQAARVQRRYLRVEGVFQADIGADFGSFSAIRDVRTLKPLKTRTEMETWRASWWLDLWPWLPLGILFVIATTAMTAWIAGRAHRRR